MPPNPLPYRRKQPDGTETPDLYLRGSPEDHNVREEDSDGFTIIHDDGSNYDVYARRDPWTGDLASTRCVVGSCDPRKEGLVRHEQPDVRVKEQLMAWTGGFGRGGWDADRKKPHLHRSRRRLMATQQEFKQKLQQSEGGTLVMKNLVLLLLFSDHMDRVLPTREDYEILFNTVDANPEDHPQCPTGSIRDFFLFNSYGKLDLQSEVFGWIELPETEAYYADGYYGVTGKFQREGIAYGLYMVERQLTEQGRSFREAFDTDDDDWIDGITVIHSGYDASMNGNDCHYPDRAKDSRIWSHKWQIPGEWRSLDFVKIGDYHANSGLWGTCGSEICRIGVIAHEHSHFLGLPDLYDGNGGNGMGNWCIMGNAWGFDASQKYPPMMMPTHKINLGWIDPVELTQDGTYHLPASHSHPFVYVIRQGYANSEYVIIENRQQYHKFEAKIPPGIIIYHMDDKTRLSREGHPDVEGWPENGHHYAYSVLAADGKYDLENANGHGDEGDVFHSDGVNGIGPDGVFADGILKAPYPRTMSYQFGKIVSLV